MVISNFMTLASTCAPAIHPDTLSAIIARESRGNIYAIGINGHHKLPRQPSTLKEAVAVAEELERNGHDFDVGLGQINVKNLGWLRMSLSDLFDPCKNLKAMQIVLTDCYQRAALRYGAGQTALQAALSCYNTGNFRHGFTNGYVQKVASYVKVKVPALAPLDAESNYQPQKSAQPRSAQKNKF